MDYRYASILPLTDLATSGTKLININLTDPISALDINYQVAVGAGQRLKHISAAFGKIELIDGSDVLVSLEGTQMRGIEYYLDKEPAMEQSTVNQSATDYGRLTYNFGRHLYDEQLALDPTKFTNPQIRLTWDVANVEANATDLDVEIFAHIFDQRSVTPAAFLMAKELERYSPSAGAWEYINLPRDYPYRALWVQGYEKGHEPYAFFDNFKLTEDVDKRVPYDLNLGDLLALNSRMFGTFEDNFGFKGASKDWAGALIPCFRTRAAMASSDVGNVTNVSVTGGGHIKIITGAASNTKVKGVYRGLVPLGLIMVPLCDLQDPTKWWDVSGLGNLQLQIQADSALPATESVRIVAQQRRPHP